jgi:hypothetical protein
MFCVLVSDGSDSNCVRISVKLRFCLSAMLLIYLRPSKQGKLCRARPTEAILIISQQLINHRDTETRRRNEEVEMMNDELIGMTKDELKGSCFSFNAAAFIIPPL